MSQRPIKFAILRFLSKSILRHFNVECDDLSNIEGPFLLLSNHTTDFDPVFVSYAVNQPVRFVASEHSMHKGLSSKLLKWAANPIIHQKGKVGIGTTKDILRAIKDGDNVGLFPEGGRSFNGETQEILSSTAKLAKSTRSKLVTVKIIGGYEVQPRWGIKKNKGHIELRLSKVYEPDELKALGEDELMESIRKDLYVKASVPKDLTGIESTLFMAKPEEINPDMDIVSLDKAQHEYVMSGAGDFSDQVSLYEVDDKHRLRLVADGLLKADKNGFSFNEAPIDVTGLAVVSRNTLIIHQDKTHYEIKGGVLFSALKYMYQYEYLLKVQKG